MNIAQFSDEQSWSSVCYVCVRERERERAVRRLWPVCPSLTSKMLSSRLAAIICKALFVSTGPSKAACSAPRALVWCHTAASFRCRCWLDRAEMAWRAASEGAESSVSDILTRRRYSWKTSPHVVATILATGLIPVVSVWFCFFAFVGRVWGGFLCLAWFGFVFFF